MFQSYDLYIYRVEHIRSNTNLSLTSRQDNRLRLRAFTRKKQVQDIPFPCNISPLEFSPVRRWLCSIDGFSVLFQPSSYGLDDLAFKRNNASVRGRAYIQEEVTSTRHDIDQGSQFLGHLVLNLSPFLPAAVAPCLREHRYRALPWGLQCGLRKLVVSHDRKIIYIISQTAAYHAIRLKRLHQIIEFAALPWLQGTHVEPELRHRSVRSKKFPHLGLAELVMFRRHEICIVA